MGCLFLKTCCLAKVNPTWSFTLEKACFSCCFSLCWFPSCFSRSYQGKKHQSGTWPFHIACGPYISTFSLPLFRFLLSAWVTISRTELVSVGEREEGKLLKQSFWKWLDSFLLLTSCPEQSTNKIPSDSYEREIMSPQIFLLVTQILVSRDEILSSVQLPQTRGVASSPSGSPFGSIWPPVLPSISKINSHYI